MRRQLQAVSSAASISRIVLLLAIVLSGCGGSGTSSPAASAEKQTFVPLASAAIVGGRIPARYTCDGANIAPPIKWGTLPTGTNEVALFVIGLTPSHTLSSIEWAMAGIKPELHGIAAGQLPSGAFLEEASDGKRQYSICPPKGQTKLYEFVLFALPPTVRVSGEINGVNLYHNLAEGPPEDRAPARGAFSATYSRRR
jgi:phosphatidylethanolamine-binding protein (PEBP) family uncharacterized protein